MAIEKSERPKIARRRTRVSHSANNVAQNVPVGVIAMPSSFGSIVIGIKVGGDFSGQTQNKCLAFCILISR